LTAKCHTPGKQPSRASSNVSLLSGHTQVHNSTPVSI
jgi:hypothetical protein